jgi:predicted DNA-binding transcriptional regulator AlpA
MSDDQLTIEEVATLAGIQPGSVYRYRARGSMPEPDGFLGRTPWWRRATIEKWLQERPSVGRPTLND